MSSFEIGFSDEAKKILKKMAGSDVKRILKHLNNLGDFRQSNNVKQLKAEWMSFYRLRVGKMRIIFEVDEDQKIIKIVNVGFRGSVYG